MPDQRQLTDDQIKRLVSRGAVIGAALDAWMIVPNWIRGKTMPKDAAPGNIRGDLASTSPAVANVQRAAVYNLVHASDNELDPEEPMKEIAYWFRSDELVDYVLVDSLAMFAPIK